MIEELDRALPLPEIAADAALEPVCDVASRPHDLELVQSGERGVDAWSPNFRFTFIGVDTDSGVSEQPGLYFVGFPWLHSRKSGIIWGVDEDAGHIAGQIAAAEGSEE